MPDGFVLTGPTTFDALTDILYGSGLCPTIRGNTIIVHYCSKSSSSFAAPGLNQTKWNEGGPALMSQQGQARSITAASHASTIAPPRPICAFGAGLQGLAWP